MDVDMDRIRAAAVSCGLTMDVFPVQPATREFGGIATVDSDGRVTLVKGAEDTKEGQCLMRTLGLDGV